MMCRLACAVSHTYVYDRDMTNTTQDYWNGLTTGTRVHHRAQRAVVGDARAVVGTVTDRGTTIVNGFAAWLEVRWDFESGTNNYGPNDLERVA